MNVYYFKDLCRLKYLFAYGCVRKDITYLRSKKKNIYEKKLDV